MGLLSIYLTGAALTGAATAVYLFKVRAPATKETYTTTWGYVETDDVNETGNHLGAILLMAVLWFLTVPLAIVMGLWHLLVRAIDKAWRRCTPRREKTHVGTHRYL
ncbi:hypothetical protein Ccr2_gp275 [Caulobacter phage Ccr2]|uniref:Transmembrane protein n=5 Tax=Viruses TaxID=10239 RepID=J3U9D3_9CAUD|nr:hypothetical protein D865_gp146 [Caulobacter phage phiCbK]ARB13806.1 hypothetical protein Ccr10_gp276 [Caulobacter phage Ccr10]ARB14151.1 hypothetical protein Ccr2_gp275 [Caulobacter phage Ccr2]ARB14845.1 hypothetical protein Ccr29_gp289 [Caulobacter phage Ccr29]ARB15185.1 hypothetical protein Ccr32_gp267 [Caulobacter phage Ccr32]ARB15519.1 hypothetical protein Ccr34_gp277 [Caulobacter phage Ccr34]